MNRRPAQIASFTVALVLVFIVGILVGQSMCAPEPEAPEQPDCPPQPPRVVEVCPEEEPEEPEEPAEPPSVEPEPQPRQADSDQLPDAPPPVDPQHRRQLLSWAQDQSSTLQSCPRDLGTTYRLAVTLQLNDERGVDGLSISAEDDLPVEFQTCIEDRIHRWELPEDIEPPGRELFFQLTL